MEGVIRTTVGYAGGSTPHPTYQRIGDHTESIEIEFDPAQLSYEELLREFWSAHNPARPAHSTQYRSAIFYHTPEQQRAATLSRRCHVESTGRRVETSLEAARPFTRAEDYHQKYRLRADSVLCRELADVLGTGDGLTDSTAAARVNGFLDGFGSPAALEKTADKLGLSPDGQRHLNCIVAGQGRRSGRTSCW